MLYIQTKSWDVLGVSLLLLSTYALCHHPLHGQAISSRCLKYLIADVPQKPSRFLHSSQILDIRQSSVATLLTSGMAVAELSVGGLKRRPWGGRGRCRGGPRSVTPAGSDGFWQRWNSIRQRATELDPVAR